MNSIIVELDEKDHDKIKKIVTRLAGRDCIINHGALEIYEEYLNNGNPTPKLIEIVINEYSLRKLKYLEWRALPKHERNYAINCGSPPTSPVIINVANCVIMKIISTNY